MKQLPKGVKEICLKCGYYDRSYERFYKCYTLSCPASIRDRKILDKEDKMRNIDLGGRNSHIWTHSKHCKCGYCGGVVGDEKYIIYDNGGDFCRLDLPKKIGDEILLQDQSGERYTLTKVRK